MTPNTPELTKRERAVIERLTDRAAVLREYGKQHRENAAEKSGHRGPRFQLDQLALALEYDKRATELEWAASVIQHPDDH
jgi:hypothetical protein